LTLTITTPPGSSPWTALGSWGLSEQVNGGYTFRAARSGLPVKDQIYVWTVTTTTMHKKQPLIFAQSEKQTQNRTVNLSIS